MLHLDEFYALTPLQFIISNLSLILPVKGLMQLNIPLPLYQSSGAHLSPRDVNNYLRQQVNWLNFSLARLGNMDYCWKDWKLVYELEIPFHVIKETLKLYTTICVKKKLRAPILTTPFYLWILITIIITLFIVLEK